MRPLQAALTGRLPGIPGIPTRAEPRDLGDTLPAHDGRAAHGTLPAHDGRAAHGPGTIGGTAAGAEHVDSAVLRGAGLQVPVPHGRSDGARHAGRAVARGAGVGRLR
ncbi:hypothetical protein ACFV20_27605 [Streptomyces sp. NPDC059696]|uniref:hypothetical protein n=1 Tax=Streptomyces sp. NPDC059696 TaxID=3346911 RepID=UPI0036C77D1D